MYRLRRYARKHRALVAVSGISLASILVLAAWGGRSWLEARHTQPYVLPLHDPQPEQQIVRERMAGIAAQQHGLGDHGDGLIHYALGRGHLVLQEFEKAHEELTRAREKGLDSPQLHYAHGRVLGELYHRGIEEARQSPDKRDTGWVARRQRELETQYLRGC